MGDFMKNKLKHGIISLYEMYQSQNVSTLASSLSYYLTLTLVPCAIAVKSIADSFSSDVFGGVKYLFPEKVRGFFDFDGTKGEGGVIAVSVLVSVYYLIRTVRALKHHLDLICGKREKRSVVYSFLFSGGVALSFLALVFICGTGILLGKNITRLPFFSRKPVGMALPVLMTSSTAFLFLFGIYRFLPDRKPSTRDVLPGTLFSLFFWWVATVVFSFYLRSFPNRSLIYDSLTSVAALMLWLYVLSNIILIGACINLLFCDGRDSRAAEQSLLR